MRDPIAEFMNFNRAFAKRNPELLRAKVARMAASAFAFFRDTFHLFARDVIEHGSDWSSPILSGAGAELDLVGDIHSENFGTYKAADGKIHYDINDFDETTRGRFDFDICRLATSWFLAARERGDGWRDAALLTQAGLDAYVQALPRFLKKGATYDVSELAASDSQPVNDLVQTEAAAKRSEFITRVTTPQNGSRRINRSQTYFNLPDEERAQALRLLEDYIRRMPEPQYQDYYKVDDVCGRVSGIGSMGRFRYAILVNGKGKKEARNVILEFKESRPSAFDLYRQRETDSKAFGRRAEIVITMQKRSQVASSPHLGFAVDGPMSFQVRELSPHDTRIDFKTTKKTESVAEVQGLILARTHARAAAHTVGVANPLAELSDPDAFCQRVLAFALSYADLTRRDWTAFVAHRGELDACEKWPGEK